MQVWTKRILWPSFVLHGTLDLITGSEPPMSNRKSEKSCGCPVTAFQGMINGKYKIRILWEDRKSTRLNSSH